jgi:magnesium-transporting ATPase (P-type)
MANLPLISIAQFRANESALTGESVTVAEQAEEMTSEI